MRASSLVVGLTAVFAGLTALLVVLAFAFELGLLVLAVPFGAATYAFWYHASGRLEARVRRRAASGVWTARRDGAGGTRETGGFGAGPRQRWTDPQSDASGFEGRRGRRRHGQEGSDRRGTSSGPNVAEAAEVLGVDPGADPATIKRAYRRRVKEVHPDTDDGDERTFKRVKQAYERLAD